MILRLEKKKLDRMATQPTPKDEDEIEEVIRIHYADVDDAAMDLDDDESSDAEYIVDRHGDALYIGSNDECRQAWYINSVREGDSSREALCWAVPLYHRERAKTATSRSMLPKIFRARRPSKSSADETAASGASFGLHTLISKDAWAPEVVDIVAIHGLNGHFMNTWTEEQARINWLRDCLAPVTETGMLSVSASARVMTFSYDSSVQFSKSVCDVFDFADQLLENILASRKTEIEKHRPIVFICHSLGGIVFKQAVVRAHEDERFFDLRQRMQAVFFFGTPHRGSDLARWASLIGAMLKAGSLASSTNTGLPKDLLPGSRILESISRSFLPRSTTLSIFSFYETKKMDYLNDVVVDRASAVMGLSNEIAIPIDGNHRTMCRFSSPHEPRFQPVIQNLSAVLHILLHKDVKNKEMKSAALLQKLARPDIKRHKERNPLPVPGTCTWLLRHPTYQDWLNDNKSCLLWISADPGCGKSVMASYLIDAKLGLGDQLEDNLCYFFFKSDFHEQRSAVVGIQGLIRQLLEKQPSLEASALDDTTEQSLEDLNILWDIFVKVSSHIYTANATTPRCNYFIIDGLDECEETDRKKLVRLMAQTFSGKQAAPRDRSKMTSIKILAFSRPNNAIKIAFDKPTPIPMDEPYTSSRTAMIRLRGEDETDALSSDIEKVIVASINNLVVDEGLPSELLEDVRCQLIKRADRTFLWVTLILQLLAEKAQAETGISRRERDALLNNRDIYAVYAELLVLRTNRPGIKTRDVRKMLDILLGATRPLTVSEMSIALAMKVVYKNHDSNNYHFSKHTFDRHSTFEDLGNDMVYPFELHLKAVCGNFVRIIRNRVYLIHETAREFLLEVRHGEDGEELPVNTPSTWDDQVTASLDDDIPIRTSHQGVARDNGEGPRAVIHSSWQHSFSLFESNSVMLHICATFLYMLGRNCNIAPFGQPSEATKDFLSYAAKSWSRHFSVVRERIHPGDMKYYENLCHPAFPGFNAWVKALFGIEHMVFAIGRTPDEIQDYITVLLGIETEPSLRDHARTDRNPDEPHSDGNNPLSTWSQAFGTEALARFSSNPATQSNSYFPLHVDDNGFVRLDYGGSSSNNTSMKDGKPNEEFAKRQGYAWVMAPGAFEEWMRKDAEFKAAQAEATRST